MQLNWNKPKCLNNSKAWSTTPNQTSQTNKYANKLCWCKLWISNSLNKIAKILSTPIKRILWLFKLLLVVEPLLESLNHLISLNLPKLITLRRVLLAPVAYHSKMILDFLSLALLINLSNKFPSNIPLRKSLMSYKRSYQDLPSYLTQKYKRIFKLSSKRSNKELKRKKRREKVNNLLRQAAATPKVTLNHNIVLPLSKRSTEKSLILAPTLVIWSDPWKSFTLKNIMVVKIPQNQPNHLRVIPLNKFKYLLIPI